MMRKVVPANIPRHTALLAAIILAGILLRIIGINSESLWYDEAYSIHLAKMNLGGLLWSSASDVHPPLYYILLNFWESIFGDSETASRILSLIFNAFTMYMLYKLGTYLFNKRTGLVSAGILAVSPFHIYYSQEARMYALLALLSIISIYYYIRLVTEINEKARLGYIISTALMVYTHIYSFWIIAFQILFSLVLLYNKKLEKKKIKAFLLSGLIIAILYMPWAGVLISQIHKVDNGFWIPKSDWFAFTEAFISFSGSLVLSAIFTVLLISGFFAIKRIKLYDAERRERTVHSIRFENMRDDIFLWLWLFVPLIIPVILSWLFEPIFNAKYAIAASLAQYLLVARAIVRINLKGVKPAALILICAFSLITIYNNMNMKTKERWRDAINYINENADAKDAIVVNSIESDDVNLYDYYLAPGLRGQKVLIKNYSVKLQSRYEKTIDSVEQACDRIWFIKTGRDCNHEELLKDFSKEYTVVSDKTFPSVYLRYLFEEVYGQNKKDLFLQKITLSSNIEVLQLVKRGSKVKFAENN